MDRQTLVAAASVAMVCERTDLMMEPAVIAMSNWRIWKIEDPSKRAGCNGICLPPDVSLIKMTGPRRTEGCK